LGASVLSYDWLAAKLERYTLKRTTGVFCSSEYIERAVRLQTLRVWRVPNPVQTPFLAVPRDRSRSKITIPILLTVGVLSANKRQLEILQMAQTLWRTGHRFELWFAGEAKINTSYAENFFRQLKQAEAAGYARHLGLLTTGKLIEVMDAAAALVHMPKVEAFGLVVAEALARNLKLFAAETGGILDITRDAPGVELFTPDDWPALTAAVGRWLTAGCPQPTSADALMRSRYAPEIIARRHVEIYEEVLNTLS
jgi:glycosyltransferase involved in cell wall biosynthesis